MSILEINNYYNQRDKLIQFGGSRNELSIRDAFKDLLNHYAEKKNLMLISEVRVQGTKGEKVQPDGTLKRNIKTRQLLQSLTLTASQIIKST